MYKAQFKKTESTVAIKIYDDYEMEFGINPLIIWEISFLQHLKHPNIIEIKEILVDDKQFKVYIVMEYYQHNLKQYLQNFEIPEYMVKSISY